MPGRAVFVTAVVLLAALGAQAATLEDLVRRSDRTVQGALRIEGTAVETVVVNPQGDPARIVCTYVAVEPTEHLKGEPVGKLVLRVLGGTLGNYAYLCPEMPPVATGERVVLFLGKSDTRRSATGEEAYYLSYGRQGKLPVTDRGGRTAVVVPEGTGRLGIAPAEAVGDTWVDYAKLRELVEAAKAGSPDR